jgi:hypothetical protein
MTQEGPSEKTKNQFSELAEHYEPKLPRKLALLLPFKAHIKELRTKHASCDAIRILLAEVNILVSNDTVHRFCREVIGQKPCRSPRNGHSPEPRDQSKVAGNNTPPSSQGLPDNPIREHLAAQNERPGATWTRPKRGPRIADSKNL